MNFETSLQQIPATGGGCHPAIMAAANIGILQGYTPDEVAQAIRASIPAGGKRRVSDREILDAVTKAANECQPDNHTGRPRTRYVAAEPIRPKVDGDKLLQAIIARSDGAQDVDLWELSPIRLDGEPRDDWRLVLGRLYNADDILFIGDTYDKQVDTAGNHIKRISADGCLKPFIIPNPVDGLQHETGSGSLSFRCDAAVSQHRFTVIEHDAMTEARQIEFWHTVCRERLLDVAVLVHSGGKSIHGWVRVNATDASDYRNKVDQLWQYLEPMGFDKATRNPARLSRLAGHKRDNGRMQRLLYLDTNGGKQ